MRMNKEAAKNEEMEKPGASPTPDAAASITLSNEEYQTLQAQVAELKDRLLRGQADWENSRKRILREKEDAVRYAGESFLERLLPVLDNFEMGMQAAKTATDAKSIA